MLWLEQLERRFLAVFQAVVSHGGDAPSWHDEQARFDEALAAEPTPVKSVDPEQLELRQVLGVA